MISTAGAVGRYIGIERFAAGSSNGQEVDIDITVTPLPAALPLFAGGLGLLGMFARRRKQKASAIADA